MTYDADLADRLRALLSSEPAVVEKRMFGGLAVLVAGHLAVSASGQGGLLLRIDPTERDALAEDPRAAPFVMRGQEMGGWLHVQADHSMSEEELSRWVKQGVAMAKSLPPG